MNVGPILPPGVPTIEPATPAARRLAELGPWEDRSALAPLGPQGLVQAWTGRLYSVQQYTVESRVGWDRLHIQRHDGRAMRAWSDLQALKLLVPDGARRLAVEVYPPDARVVDLCHAYHLWVLPADDPVALLLDVAHELGGAHLGDRWTDELETLRREANA